MIDKRTMFQNAIDSGISVSLNVLSLQGTILNTITPDETYDLEPQEMLLLVFNNGRHCIFNREHCLIYKKGGK